jgi:hypothetical protein
MLQDTSIRVTMLRERYLASSSVTQAIAGCFTEIDRYLADYLVVLYSLLRVFAFTHFSVVSGRPRSKVNVTHTKRWQFYGGRKRIVRSSL